MSRALPGALWFFLSAWWFLADAWLAQAMGAWRVDLAVVFCVFAAVAARPSVLPWLLLCAGLGRALTLGGAACMHVLLLGVPVVILFPLRRLAAPAGLIHVAVAGFATVLLPWLSELAQRVADGPPPPLSQKAWPALLWTMLTAPLGAALLGRLPPLWFFREAPG